MTPQQALTFQCIAGLLIFGGYFMLIAIYWYK